MDPWRRGRASGATENRRLLLTRTVGERSAPSRAPRTSWRAHALSPYCAVCSEVAACVVAARKRQPLGRRSDERASRREVRAHERLTSMPGPRVPPHAHASASPTRKKEDARYRAPIDAKMTAKKASVAKTDASRARGRGAVAVGGVRLLRSRSPCGDDTGAPAAPAVTGSCVGGGPPPRCRHATSCTSKRSSDIRAPISDSVGPGEAGRPAFPFGQAANNFLEPAEAVGLPDKLRALEEGCSDEGASTTRAVYSSAAARHALAYCE